MTSQGTRWSVAALLCDLGWTLPLDGEHRGQSVLTGCLTGSDRSQGQKRGRRALSGNGGGQRIKWGLLTPGWGLFLPAATWHKPRAQRSIMQSYPRKKRKQGRDSSSPDKLHSAGRPSQLVMLNSVPLNPAEYFCLICCWVTLTSHWSWSCSSLFLETLRTCSQNTKWCWLFTYQHPLCPTTPTGMHGGTCTWVFSLSDKWQWPVCVSLAELITTQPS